MQDGDANFAIFVDVGVPDLGSESHGRRHIGEVLREDEASFEKSTFVEGSVGSHDKYFPFVHIAFINETHGDEVDRVLGKLCNGVKEGREGREGTKM